ncbi:MAG TPA: glycerophosphodiester phosphodiesterase [Gemmatimonadaceae bacterium]|nr:glycerophosphodiester phosphodiesterase [Gemmatimonadaceae bacterium]
MSPLNTLLDPAGRIVIGHRGAAARAPENTLESFRLALQHGAQALELDVHAARDGTPVVIHDPDLRRTTDQAGPVADLPLRAIRGADAGHAFTPDGGRTFPWRGRGVRVPTLAEVLEEFPDTPLLIELKTRRVQHAVARLLRAHAAEARSVVAAADHGAVALFRQAPFLVGASRRDIARLYFGLRAGLWLPRPQYCLLSVPLTFRGLYVPTPRFVAAARRLGATVHVWTVDEPSVARRLWDDGVSGVVTNDTERIVAGAVS